ncbi:hypothetical protein HGB13_03580 [bacterium]|nr:hypothetical protein [bacterium]
MGKAISSRTFLFVRELLSIKTVRNLYLKVEEESYILDIEIASDDQVSKDDSLTSVDITSIYVGIVSKILISVGDTVDEQQALIIVDTLGLEHEIIAPLKGIVESIEVKIDDCLEYGSIILRLKSTI